MSTEGHSTSNPWVVAAAFVVIAAGIKAAEIIMVPFLLAAFIATVAATPMFWLHRHRVPIGLAILAVIAGLLVVLFGVGALVAQAVAAFTDELPVYQARATELATQVLEWPRSLGVEISADWILGAFNPAIAFSMAGNTLRGLQQRVVQRLPDSIDGDLYPGGSVEFSAKAARDAEVARPRHAVLRAFSRRM